VLFEAPGRMATTLDELARTCGPERPGAVARELTKMHETIERGTLGELAARAADGAIPARGEVTIVVGWRPAGAAGPWSGTVGAGAEASGGADGALGGIEAARARVDALVAEGLARGDAARRVAGETGIPRRQLYGATKDR